MRNFAKVFGQTKPVIGMVHLGALPGSPLYDEKAGIAGLLAGAQADLRALQAAGFDAVMFGNENDRPYEFAVDTASTATMAAVIGALRSVAERAKAGDPALKSAPHHAPRRRLDETQAARKPVLVWHEPDQAVAAE